MLLTGKCGITLNADWNEPKDASSQADKECSETMNNIKLGWYAQPVFGNGDYPDALKKACADMATMAGEPTSSLPEFTAEEIALNKGNVQEIFDEDSAKLKTLLDDEKKHLD